MRRFLGSRFLSLLPLFTLLSLTLFIHAPLLTKPFYGHHDWVSVLYGQIARNNLRYGLLETHFGQVTSAGLVDPSKFAYHTHHPVLWPLMITASVAVFGLYEWTIRLLPLVSSLGAVSIYYVLIRRYFGSFISFFSSVFFISTPMFLYFGILPDKEPFVLFLLLLTLFYYLIHPFIPLFIVFLLGGLTHWLFYLLPPVFFLHHVLTYHRLKESLILLFTLYSLLFLTLSFHLWHTRLLTGDYLGGGLRETLQFRLSSTASDKTNFTTLEYVSKLFVRLGNYFGWIVLPFVGISLIQIVRRGWLAGGDPTRAQRPASTGGEERETGPTRLLLLFLPIGLLYPIVFRNYVYIHDYLLYYMLPFWGLSVTLGIIKTVRFLKTRLDLPFPLPLFTLLSLSTLLVLTLVDRAPMITALRTSDWYKNGKEVGEIVSLYTGPTDKIAIIATSDFSQTYARFIDFYGDRSVTYLEGSEKDTTIQSYNLVLLIPNPIKHTNLETKLGKSFHRVDEDGTMEIYKKGSEEKR